MAVVEGNQSASEFKHTKINFINSAQLESSSIKYRKTALAGGYPFINSPHHLVDFVWDCPIRLSWEEWFCKVT